MFELMAVGQGNSPNSKFKYLGETTGPTYTEVLDAMGIVGGTRQQGNAYLSFLEEGAGDIWLVAKKQVVSNVEHSKIDAAGGFSGKSINIAGESYFCRTMGMTTRGFTSADIPSGGVGQVAYTKDSTFANSEFNKIFYQVVNLTGESAEGIEYGTAAKFSLSDLGFSSAVNGAIIGREASPDGYRIVVAGNFQVRYSRKLVSPYHGWRPMLRK